MENKPLKFLIVDDNKDHAFIISDAIRSYSPLSKVAHITDGDEVINYLSSIDENELPEIILLDIKMPKKNGFEVLEFIRNNKRCKHIPVIMLSTSSQAKEIELAYSMKVNTFFSKPVKFNEFVQVIQQISSYWSNAEISIKRGIENYD